MVQPPPLQLHLLLPQLLLLLLLAPSHAPAAELRHMERHRNSRSCSTYRSLNGYCTNPFFRSRGAANSPHISLLRPLRSTAHPTGTNLPSARLVSNTLCVDQVPRTNARRLRELAVFFGQFIDHNIVATPSAAGDTLPIPIPANDPEFGRFASGKLPFKRSRRISVQVVRWWSRTVVQRPLNELPTYLDLCAVYAAEPARARQLRTGTGGRLTTSPGDFPPLNVAGLRNSPSTSPAFFLTGDHRANEHPVLASLHTIFLREHNSLADEIAGLFPHWTDERVFQEARAINIAQFQKMVLEEFYPAFTGRSLPPYRGLRMFARADVLDVFAAAAFRLHTMVRGPVARAGPGGKVLPQLATADTFFRPAAKLVAEGVDVFLRGALVQTAQELDLQISDVLRNFLFTGVGGDEDGFDLAALNIQRGRDHALPGYNAIRGALGLGRVTGFSGITRDAGVQAKLANVYSDVDQVEAWVGMMAEDHVHGASMGRTMLAVWERQFSAIRDGDRFYYRRGAFPRELFQHVPRVRRLFSGGSVFREVVLRNSGLESSEVGSRVFF